MALRNQPPLKHPAGTGKYRDERSKYGSVDHTTEVLAKRRQLLAHHRAKMDAKRGEVPEAPPDDVQHDSSGDQA